MKFGQLIECNMRNILLEISYTICSGETSPRVEGYWKILKLSCRPLAFSSLSFKLFELIKRGPELLSLPHFLHSFWRKIFLLLYSHNWPNFIDCLPLLCEILGNIRIAIVRKPICDGINFEVNLIFLIKSFFLHDQKFVTKT